MVEMLDADVVCHGRDGLVGGLHGLWNSVGAACGHGDKLPVRCAPVDAAGR